MRQLHGRINELDVLRGIAAMAVVLFHYTTQYDQLFGHSPSFPIRFPIGSYGVHLFFIISGFVIFMSLERTKKPLDFVIARFSRLYPAYWIAIAITFSILLFFPLQGRTVSFSHALINLTMLQNFINVPSVDGVYWTLCIELKFYAIIFLLFLFNILKKIELVCLSWIVSLLFFLHSHQLFSHYRSSITIRYGLSIAHICLYPFNSSLCPFVYRGNDILQNI